MAEDINNSMLEGMAADTMALVDTMLLVDVLVVTTILAPISTFGTMELSRSTVSCTVHWRGR